MNMHSQLQHTLLRRTRDARGLQPPGVFTVAITLLLLFAGAPSQAQTTPPVPPAILDLALEPPVINTAPGPEYSDEQRDYAMIIGLDRTPKGRLWAAWVAGGDSEKGYFVAATSDDDGVTWSAPRLVIDPPEAPTGLHRRILVGNFWTDPTGRLWLFFDQSMGYFDGRGGAWAITCDNPDADEPKWSAPRRIWHGATLNKPIVLKSGEWLMPISLWTRDRIRPAELRESFHELDDVRMANLFVSTDQGSTWTRRGGVTIPETDFDEHMFVELKDGRLWLLARTKYGIAETFSSDQGRTWTEPKPSTIQNPSARFFLRRLKSGRILLVKNGPLDKRIGRAELTAFISEDEGRTWQGGLLLDDRQGLSYPDGFESPDGAIHILYDRNRAADREILMARFREEDVLTGQPQSPGTKLKLLVSKAHAKAGAPNPAQQPIRELKATARAGQVFVTWQEQPTAAGTTFNVYVDDQQITDVKQARLAAHHIEPHSARDWWEDPATFTKGAPHGKPVGWLLVPGQPRLDPSGGLFAFTPGRDAREPLHFAITRTDATGQEYAAVGLGVNSLRDGVTPVVGAPQAIWQRAEPQPSTGAGSGKPLSLSLHGKSGVVANAEYLAFGDEALGWRAGLPFKFSAAVGADEVLVRPTDRVWINRPHGEATDGGAPAIWTFWYGYNSKIYDRTQMATGTPTNYTERRLLWILDFVERHYGTDPQRRYCSGSSMGGCGTISFGLRHPELFAALHAHVPIVSYTYLGTSSAKRLEPCCWTGTIGDDVRASDGLPLLERMNGERLVRETKGDLPPLSMVHGRRDGSIPWQNNPPFYAALAAARQSYTVYWDDGTHPTAGQNAPADVADWKQRLRRFKLNESYPAFANVSTNRDAGDGSPTDGDIVGWHNRGLDWNDIVDTPEQYAITLSADDLGSGLPVCADVTLRRVQWFKMTPGERLNVQVGDAAPTAVTVDAAGHVTIKKLTIPSGNGVRVTWRRG